MKLLTLKITSEFRNLENLNLSFDPANDTYVIIGNILNSFKNTHLNIL